MKKYRKNNPTPLGKLIKIQCIENEISITELGLMLGVKQQYISYIIYGERGTGKYTEQIADFLGIDAEQVENLGNIRKSKMKVS
ncbi:helix-turn-helix domain-containing protein [Vallitalea guaymasensis]|uniref:helix-turn-helix domain-containing protein n=1 Tax=Vallitalea guaymasensis TaxID=1185412 RepID=UPI00187D380D|nr:helix-turn-helix transcriptional regulator [Vallitalea guaymasensis]